MKKIINILMVLTLAIEVNAVPAKPGVVKVTMADGSVKDAKIVGDEYWHCVADLTGNVFAVNQEGLYEMSSVKLRDIDIKEKMKAARRSRPETMKPMKAASFNRGIVILVSFSDKQFKKSRAAFDEMLNEESSNPNNESGSVRDYFNNSSFGAFVPQFDVYGPYTLDHKCQYYGGNYGGNGTDQRASQMVVDAVAEYIKENGENALQQYDCNGDGYVDNVFIYYAGHGENAGGGANCIWPHRSYIYSGWVEGRTTYGGVELGDYACSCELQGASGSTMSGIGPFCHEFSHVLGLPDMYDTGYSGHRTCSNWDVMDAGNYLNGEHTPPSYSSYERFYMGWLTPEILSEPDNIKLDGLNGSNSAKIVTMSENHNLDGSNPDPEEFYMFEVRDGKGWDKYLPGQGMLITKVRYDYMKWAYNEVNNHSDDMGVDIIEAGGVQGYAATASDAFPGTDNVTEYTPYSGQPITEITFNRDNVTFKYKGGREKFKVTFDGMERGTPAVDEIYESVKDEGVMLPNVNDVEYGYVFEGWSESASATEAEAGVAGQMYYPEIDVRLFAVYSRNGVVVPTDTGCVVETFDKCTGQYDIGERMDRYTDILGWYGESVKCSSGAVKMGANEEKGYLISPRLHLSGDMTLAVTCKALMNTTLIVTAENGNSDTVAIGTEYENFMLKIDAVPIDSRLKFSSDANIFFIDDVEFCGAAKSPVENVEGESQYALLRHEGVMTIIGLKGGERIRVLDMLGRVLVDRVCEETEASFETGRGLYMVQIIENDKIIVLK